MLDIREQMLQEIRELSAANARAQNPPSRSRNWMLRVRAALRPTQQRVLAAGAMAGVIAAAVVYISHWPPGGGTRTSSFVFTQGASLVFVVILLSLLAGPVSAGRALGWDSGWILRDRQVWTALGAVGTLSLFELWLAWVQPERPEEGATILLTAAGLILTVFTASRLVHLSDPTNQLVARTQRQVPRLMAEMRAERARAAAEMRRQGISSSILAELELQTPATTQTKVRHHLMKLRSVTERAIHDSNWDLASFGHRAISHLMQSYARQSIALSAQDKVLEAFCEVSDDLHAQIGTARGREFSSQLVQNVRDTALVVALKDAERYHGPYADVLAGDTSTLRLVMTLENVIARRLTDSASADAPNALQAIGELAAINASAGHSSTANDYLARLLKYATAGTKLRKPEIAWPAWRGVLKTLGVHAYTTASKRSPYAFSEASRSLENAIEEVGTYPQPLHYSGFEPIGGSSPQINQPDMRTLAYSIAESRALDDADICDWALGMTRALSGLTHAALRDDDHAGYWALKEAAETMHHINLAVVVRACTRDSDGGSELITSLGNQLSWMRTLAEINGAESSVDLEAWAHPYLTDAIAASYSLATKSEGAPEALTTELGRFAEDITKVDGRDASAGFSDMVATLAKAMASVDEALSSRLTSAAATILTKIKGADYGNGLSEWGHLHRGAVIHPIVDDVDEWLTGLPDAPPEEPTA